ncbi:hypothetical protein [Stenomitos frigidus]|uniref:hypothetical protein n=1 Tax=Stenomitos frigidus TaxID=1886765 RepID=UPI001FE4C6F2|nr:hypothetical protein [Stenomitos frigidus]
MSAVTIGSNVAIGSGAKIIRPVSIGNGAQIGANAVVLSDVPANASAVGIPAKVIVKAAVTRCIAKTYSDRVA